MSFYIRCILARWITTIKASTNITHITLIILIICDVNLMLIQRPARFQFPNFRLCYYAMFLPMLMHIDDLLKLEIMAILKNFWPLTFVSSTFLSNQTFMCSKTLKHE